MLKISASAAAGTVGGLRQRLGRQVGEDEFDSLSGQGREAGRRVFAGLQPPGGELEFLAEEFSGDGIIVHPDLRARHAVVLRRQLDQRNRLAVFRPAQIADDDRLFGRRRLSGRLLRAGGRDGTQGRRADQSAGQNPMPFSQGASPAASPLLWNPACFYRLKQVLAACGPDRQSFTPGALSQLRHGDSGSAAAETHPRSMRKDHEAAYWQFRLL